MASAHNSSGPPASPPSPSLSDGVEPTLGQLFLSGSTNVKGDIQSFLARLARSPQVLAEEAKEHHARTHRRIRRRRKPASAATGTEENDSAASSSSLQTQPSLPSSPMASTPDSIRASCSADDQGPPRKRARPASAPLSRVQRAAPQQHAIADHGVLRRAPPVPILPQQQQRPQLRCEELQEQHHQQQHHHHQHDEQKRVQRHHSTPAAFRPEPSSSPSSFSLSSSASMPDLLGNVLDGFPNFPYAHHPQQQHPSPSPASLLNDSLSLDVNRLIYDIGDYCLSLCSDISLICNSPPPPARPASPVPQYSSATKFSRPFPPSASSAVASSSAVGSGVHQQQQQQHHHHHQQQEHHHQQHHQYHHHQQLHHGGIGHGPPHAPSSPVAAPSRLPQSPYAGGAPGSSMVSSSSQCSSGVSSPYLPSPPPSFALGVTVPSPPALSREEQAAASSRHPTYAMRTSFYAEEPYYQPAPPTPEETPRQSRHHAPQHQPPHHHHQQSSSSSSYRQQQQPQPQFYERQATHGRMAADKVSAETMSEADEVAALIRDFLQEEGEGPDQTQYDSSLLYSSPTGRSRRQPPASRREQQQSRQTSAGTTP